MVGKRSHMMLFVRDLPENITRNELRTFFQMAVKDTYNGWFSLKASVCHCAILRITDRTNGATEHHGLVEVQPAKAAMCAIENLSGKEFKGARIEVRRYHHRSLLRDRRQSKAVHDDSDCRLNERRRKNIKIDLVNSVQNLRSSRQSDSRKSLKIDLVGV